MADIKLQTRLRLIAERFGPWADHNTRIATWLTLADAIEEILDSRYVLKDEPRPGPKFKVGDKVGYVYNSAISVVTDVTWNDKKQEYYVRRATYGTGPESDYYLAPEPDPPAIKVGDYVEMHGLSHATEWNGKCGKVMGQTKMAVWIVETPELIGGKHIVNIETENLKILP